MSMKPDGRSVHSTEVAEWSARFEGFRMTNQPGRRHGRMVHRRARSLRGADRPLIDFLLPATDEGVYAQAIGALMLFSVALWFVRRNRDLVLFVAGLATLTAGRMGLRALH